MIDPIQYFSIKELFSSDQYVIPIYQRNYAWTEKEITQLVQDIADYATEKQNTNYYIGTLVVYERQEKSSVVYETIDGQQRLTTLNLLLNVLKDRYGREADINDWYQLNLSFDSRPKSTQTLYMLATDTRLLQNEDHNTAIKQGFEDAYKALQRVFREKSGKLTPNQFCDYLFNRVMLLRVAVPEDTDLNHYFEIMNSRGEQLEKHEILKASCLDVIKDDEKASYAFNLIWEACANMERYIQYGFGVGQRDKVFGPADWNELQAEDLDSLAAALSEAKQNKEGAKAIPIYEILKDQVKEPDTDGSKDAPERFNSVINFSNFLLHVLRIQEGAKKDIALDDKRLIDSFDPYIKKTGKEDAIAFVKLFGFNLLKCKFLFDKYIIKREFLNGADKWSLKSLKKYAGGKVGYVNSFGSEDDNDGDENRNILMLLAMFHVSTPTLVYKHWLNAALKFVFTQKDISAKTYINYLERLAKVYLHDRFLTTQQKDYYEIMYQEHGMTLDRVPELRLLDQGTGVENFVFNYLDYLLWKGESKYQDFEFTFRSSVEHYYPQHPIGDNIKLKPSILDNFGNLCLISNSKNSRLSNYMPQAKKDHYRNSSSIDSIKQQKMMENDYWGESEILEHSIEMKRILLNEIGIDYDAYQN